MKEAIRVQWQHWLSSVQFSHSVVSDCLWPHESQHARPPCPSPTPGVHSDSRPSSWWCHPAISLSVVPFSSCSQSLPASESFPMSQLFTWGGQSTRVSALASFLPKKSQGWSPSEWTGWISLQSKGLSRVFSNTTEDWRAIIHGVTRTGHNLATNHMLSQLGKQSLFSRKQAIPLHLFHVFYKEHYLLENKCRGTTDEMTCMWVSVWKIRWNRGALHQYWIRNADITPGAVSCILLPVPWKREITKITSTSSKRVYIPVSLWL